MISRLSPPFLFILSLFIVLFSDGAVYPAPLSIAAVLMALSLAAASLTGNIPRFTARAFWLATGIWAFLLLWTIIQVIPLPQGIFANADWQRLKNAGIDVPGRIAIMPGDAFSAIIPISLPFMAFLATLHLLPTDRSVERGLRIFAVAGSLLAIAAVFQFLVFPQILMFAPKQAYLDSLTLPFVNRNTAATFYGLTTIALIVCLALSTGGTRRAPRDERARIWENWRLYASLLIPTLVGLGLTGSRAGIASTMVAAGLLICTLAVHVLNLRHFRERLSPWLYSWGLYLVVPAAILLVALLSYLLFGRAILRAEIQGGDDGRFCVLPGIWHAVQDNWLVGIGPGAFRHYFPAYRSPDCTLIGIWFKAHNFYLDALLAFGIIVTAVLLAAIVAGLVTAYRTGLRKRRSMKPVVLGGIAATVLTALHAATDFSLQIPGFSMCFAIFLAMTITASLNPAGNHNQK